MTRSEEFGVCDTCGKPATQWARDMFRHEGTGMYAEFSPSSFIKRGCDDHPVESETHPTLMPLPEPPK